MNEQILHVAHCHGCGIQLQTVDSNAPGYVPEQAMQKEAPICRRCYRIKHYNEALSAPVNPDEFSHLLGQVASTNCLVVHIVDIFDFEGSFISSLKRFVGENPILLVASKLDLLPKSVNPNRLVNWIRKQAKELGIKPVDVVLCSARYNIGFDRLLHALNTYRGQRDIVVVGAANVGKSTLINRLIRDYSDLETELTTSRYPGTTLDLVRIPLDDGHVLVDSPGVLYAYRLTERVHPSELKTIVPDKSLKPVVYQLQPEQTVFMGGYARFDFVQGKAQSFTFYMSSKLKLHRTKLASADNLYQKHKGELLSPPNKENLNVLPPWMRHEFTVTGSQKKDVFISGLGWISVNGKTGAKLVLHVPKGIRVGVRDALV